MGLQSVQEMHSFGTEQVTGYPQERGVAFSNGLLVCREPISKLADHLAHALHVRIDLQRAII
jgi:hypothetical protein